MSYYDKAANEYIEKFCIEMQIDPAPWFKEKMHRELTEMLEKYAAVDLCKKPVASCMICGHEKELGCWLDPSLVKDGSFHGVCLSCREAAQHRLQSDGAKRGLLKEFDPYDLNDVAKLNERKPRR
jgi:hypothetical protein